MQLTAAQLRPHNVPPPSTVTTAAMIPKYPIEPAKLLTKNSFTIPGAMLVTEYTFQVPLDYSKPDADTVTLFARATTPYEKPIVVSEKPPSPRPYMLFLQGGPGFGCSPPEESGLTSEIIARGYQTLYLDHRGVGLSTPVTTETLKLLGGDSVDGQVDYLRLMRQDNTVRDGEAVRKLLNKDLEGDAAKWSIMGQSYGGFVGLSYLSMHPEGLRECFFTGGLAPIGKTAEELYDVTFGRVSKRTEQFYEKFPQDVANVKRIAAHIESKGGRIPLPGGGFLTVQRFLSLGIAFGGHGGFNELHNLITGLTTSLDQFGIFARPALAAVEAYSSFDASIIYAILHEAIYCDGPISTSWSAQRAGEKRADYFWLKQGAVTTNHDGPLYFSGEMVFPWDFEVFDELIPLREAANKIAEIKDWGYIYDQDQLRKNEVPVYAVSYVNDMFVDFNFATNTSNMTKNTKVFATNAIYHNGIRAKVTEVCKQLFNLRDDTID